MAKLLSYVDNLEYISTEDYINMCKDIPKLRRELLYKIIRTNSAVKEFINSKLYYILRTEYITDDEKYRLYLETRTTYTDLLPKQLLLDLLKLKYSPQELDNGKIDLS